MVYEKYGHFFMVYEILTVEINTVRLYEPDVRSRQEERQVLDISYNRSAGAEPLKHKRSLPSCPFRWVLRTLLNNHNEVIRWRTET